MISIAKMDTDILTKVFMSDRYVNVSFLNKK